MSPSSDTTPGTRRWPGDPVAGLFRYAGGEYQPRHAHDRTTLSMVLTGSVSEQVGGHSVRATALNVVVKPAGTYHEDRFTSRRAVLVQIALSPEGVREALDAGCPLDRWGWYPAGGAAHDFVRLAALCAESPTGPERVRAVVDCLAGLDIRRHETSTPPWLETVRRRIREAERDGGPSPSISELARDAGVHRVHLSREFRRHFSCSPTEFRLRVRLERATESIGSTAGTLSRVAHAAGYADQPHMTRAFRERLGITPLQYKRLVGRA